MNRISVLMGIYNCADTLPEALDSLLSQTYQNFKVILCDDGSKDDTFKVAQSYVENFPEKFILIRNETNKGLNHTLNRCLQLADTEYIARMDGDDISLPERFEKEIDFLDTHKEFAVVSCPMIHFDEEGDFKTGKATPKPQKKDIPKGSPICHAPCMGRAEAFYAVNGYSEDNKFLRVEDYHLWIKMYEKGYRAYNLSEPLYKMRDDRNALIRRNWRNRKNEMIVKLYAIKKLKLPFYYRVYVLKPLIAYLAPKKIYNFIHRK